MPATPIDRGSLLRTYRWYAPLYDWVFGRVLDGGRRALCRAVAELAPAKLLEVGVGTGRLLPHYPADTAIAGIDLSPEMLRQARRHGLRHVRAADRAATRAVPLLMQGDAEQLPFADHSFDCVTLPYVITVTPDPARMLREAERVCRADGDLLILGHFGGRASALGWAERALAPLAGWLGFRSNLAFDSLLAMTNWRLVSDHGQLFGIFRLLHLRRDG